MRATSGISAAGATLTGNVKIDTVIPIYIGDVSDNLNSTTLTINDATLTITATNTFSATTITASNTITSSGIIRANAGLSAAGSTFTGLLRASAGICASGGTFNGTITFVNGATFSGTISAPNIVNSVNGLTGTIGLSAGSNITITTSGNTLIFASTASGGGGAVSSVQGLTGDVTIPAADFYLFNLGII